MLSTLVYCFFGACVGYAVIACATLVSELFHDDIDYLDLFS